MINLTGKTAIVTGAGRGIGRAIALKLAEAGAAVVLNDLDDAPLGETRSLVQAAAGRVETLAGDITSSGLPARLAVAAIDSFGGIDIIVNNAGYTWDNVIQKTSDEQFQAMLDIHLVAPFRLLRAASNWIRETTKAESARGERIMRKVVNTSSVSGTDGNAGQIGYAAGKSGINGMTKTLAKEWGRYNVNVNSVAYGLIATRLTQDRTQPGASLEVHGRSIGIGVQPAALEAVKALCPLGRPGTAEEAAGPVLFLCSPLSDYVSGEVLVCAGGMRS
ncbi:MAG: SDR family oxidoreductase [Acidobacteria bacterium]|nr:SDR family oxidoreductase [Acidobacteriota bacterium]